MGEYRQDQLFEQMRRGDRSALQAIFEKHYDMVFSVILRLAKDKDLAEDLAQDVFVRFWEKRSRIQINSSLGAYLRRMAINEALGYLRKNGKYFQESIDDHTPTSALRSSEDDYLHQELQQKVQQAILMLPPKCRLVFQLSRQEELTYQEIADKMDISVKTVENQMSKALKILRRELQHYLRILL